MRLKSIDYSQYERTPKAWKLTKCEFGNINLIVGKNATGKSRTLNIIASLGNLLGGYQKMVFSSGNYKVTFDNEGKKIDYILKYKDSVIKSEKLNVDSQNRLNRGIKGEGTIYYSELKGTMKFQTPENELASVARRDSIQHPFLQDLYDWGRSVAHYKFGSTLGQDKFALYFEEKEKKEKTRPNLKDTSNVVAIFRQGEKDFSDKFTNPIIHDMNKIGFEITSIGASKPVGMKVESNIPIAGGLFGLYVQEKELKMKTYQSEMSQGMFRTLSLLIQIRYSQLAQTPSCILVDDIGEGLDYERSLSLVKLLVKRAEGTNVQLIMTSNDRIVMNNVPLEYWSIMHRVGGVCNIYNYKNSPKLFDDFALTGLNNYDFFSSYYYLKEELEK